MSLNSRVGSIPDAHYNQTSNPSDGIALVNGYEKINSLTLYIPDRIDMDRILEQNPPNFRCNKDHFVYILSLITSIPSRRRELIEQNNGYTPINKSILQKRNRDYAKYIKYLVDNGIVKENRQYKPGVFSRGLKFTEAYNSAIVPVEITTWTLIKSISYKGKVYNEEMTEELSYLKKWFNDKLVIDFEKGVNYLSREYISDVYNTEIEYPLLRYNSRLLPLQKLYRNEYSFHVDNTGYRLHTGLTQLKSELRNCMTYDGRTLCNVDITNSQPFLSTALLDKEVFIRTGMDEHINNPNLCSKITYPNMIVKMIEEIENMPDVVEYKELVSSGSFYETFAESLLESGLIEPDTPKIVREKAKEITFSAIYSPNSHIGWNPVIRIFQARFPNVYRVFKLIKKGSGNHGALAIALQRLEADLVLKQACNVISFERPDTPLFTIHDSITTTEDNVEYVVSVLSRVLRNNIGISPRLKQELWNDELIRLAS